MKAHFYALACFAFAMQLQTATGQNIKHLIDKRDGQEYRIINIGNHLWMAENLNIGNMISSDKDPKDNNIIEKYCYNNNPDNCDTYGGIYRWNEAMNYGSGKDICPDGWHIPTNEEWKKLEIAMGMSPFALDSIGWRGKNAGEKIKNNNGFNVTLGGYAEYSGNFASIGLFANFWTSTMHTDTSMVFYRSIGKDYPTIDHDFTDKNMGLSIRCIKD